MITGWPPIGRDAAELSDSLAAYRQGETRPGLTDRTAAGRDRAWCSFSPGRVPSGAAWDSNCTPTKRSFATRWPNAIARRARMWITSVIDELLAGNEPRRHRRDPARRSSPMQVALAALWRSWGVEPAVVIGHSMGEVAAAHVAGALSLDDAARVICTRARLLRGAAPRRGDDLRGVVPRRGGRTHRRACEGDVAVAASNSVRSTVLSGDSDVLAELMIRDSESTTCGTAGG